MPLIDDTTDYRVDGERPDATPVERLRARLEAVELSIILALPYPPTINHYYQRGKAGRLSVGARGIEYRQQVRTLLMCRRIQPVAGIVGIAVLAYPPDRRKRDADNLWKCLLDSLTHGGLWEDDSIVTCQGIIMDDPRANGGGLTVQVWKTT